MKSIDLGHSDTEQPFTGCFFSRATKEDRCPPPVLMSRCQSDSIMQGTENPRGNRQGRRNSHHHVVLTSNPTLHSNSKLGPLQKLAFQEELCPDRHAMQTFAAGVPTVSFDDSTVDDKSRLAVAVTIVSTVALGEGCNRPKGLLFKLHCGQPVKELQKWISHEWVDFHMLHTVHTQNSPPPGSAKIRTGSIADRESYAAFFHGKQWTTASWNCQHLSSQICKHASQWPGPCY